MAKCKERVGHGFIVYGCNGDEGHSGPHWAVEVPASTRERTRWEDEQAGGDEARAVLAETQGKPETFAERNPAHVPTAVPGEVVSTGEAVAWMGREDMLRMVSEALGSEERYTMIAALAAVEAWLRDG